MLFVYVRTSTLLFFKVGMANDDDLWLSLDTPDQSSTVKDQSKQVQNPSLAEEKKSKKSKKKGKDSERSCEYSRKYIVPVL